MQLSRLSVYGLQAERIGIQMGLSAEAVMLGSQKVSCRPTFSSAVKRFFETEDFTTYPRAPARKAWLAIWEVSCWLKMITSVCGSMRRISRVASNPFKFGML